MSVVIATLAVVLALVINGTITRGNSDTVPYTNSDSAAAAVGEEDKSEEIYLTDENETPEPITETKKIVVLDPGHGKSSGAMSDAEKEADGWVYDSNRGGWGEWRHWKSGTMWQDCEGFGCNGRAPSGGGCWYPIGNGDRDGEPSINLNNAEYAKIYLEEMGYEVRMTRESDDQNPSMTKRLTYCYKNRDTASEPDADIFVCIHSNAGGGSGSAYMSLSGSYDQGGVLSSGKYVEKSNLLGSMINKRIVSDTSLSAFGGGEYSGLPEAILFCKSPVPIAYLEIGFFDNDTDLNILSSESEQIGKAIADGINDYFVMMNDMDNISGMN